MILFAGALEGAIIGAAIGGLVGLFVGLAKLVFKKKPSSSQTRSDSGDADLG